MACFWADHFVKLHSQRTSDKFNPCNLQDSRVSVVHANIRIWSGYVQQLPYQESSKDLKGENKACCGSSWNYVYMYVKYIYIYINIVYVCMCVCAFKYTWPLYHFSSHHIHVHLNMCIHRYQNMHMHISISVCMHRHKVRLFIYMHQKNKCLETYTCLCTTRPSMRRLLQYGDRECSSRQRHCSDETDEETCCSSSGNIRASHLDRLSKRQSLSGMKYGMNFWTGFDFQM